MEGVGDENELAEDCCLEDKPPSVVADVGGATQMTWGLGYSYAFTKRTNVYAMYAYVNNFQGIAGLSGNTGTVGLRHMF
jgi:predicted porin